MADATNNLKHLNNKPNVAHVCHYFLFNLASLLTLILAVLCEITKTANLAVPQGTQTVMPFQRPIFIVAALRSGNTMLFETLCVNAAVWSTGDESHQTLESIPELGLAAHGFESNALAAADTWQSGKFVTCPNVPGSSGPPWSLL